MATPNKIPATITIAAPERLVNTLAQIGYNVQLVITRNGKMLVDPGADADDIDAPIVGHDLSNLRATLAAYEVQDKDPAGPRFEPPPA